MANLSDRLAGLTKVPQPQSPDKAGFVVDTASNTVPNGWLECNGQAVSRTTYGDLFDAIGTTYGIGDGSTTFNLPDGSVLNSPTGTDEIIILKNGNGHGSTNTGVRRFSTVVTNSGSDMTLTQSATLGDSITINEDGIYWISYIELRVGNATPEWGITLNSTALSTTPSVMNDSEVLAGWVTDQDESNAAGSQITYTGPLSSGDIIRGQSSTVLQDGDNTVRLYIRQLFRS